MAVHYRRLDALISHRPTTPRPSLPAAGAVGLAVDSTCRTVTAHGRELALTFMEFELLAHLVAQPLRVHTRSQLMETLWGRPDNGDTRTLSTHVARIRRKLGPALAPAIATVRQVGYKYDPRLTRTA
ncbi:winged helix-turn-helix domain-containing protein [Kitasatospora humi]|uniref:winged helix-turn-helix domain-containing protein n=1 Tax=Kitasatospora humi TaxID=2893891 RepID=UPI0027E0FEC9|nr:winged helix-turn-helix domain-containing protein [Kitasatospora humi]